MIAQSSPSVDRRFLIMLSVSLLIHAIVVATSLISGRIFWKSHPPLELIYESKRSAPTVKPLKQPASYPTEPEAEQRSERLARAARGMIGNAAGTLGAGPDMSGFMTRIHVGMGAPSEGWASTGGLPAGRDAWAGAVDLTNLTVAARGNPVLYSYFGAIRERIQQTADERVWLPEKLSASGTIYVGFVVNQAGVLISAEIVKDRSSQSAALQDAAVRIVKAANPFLPFPPSVRESSKILVVPLEFVSSPAN